MCKHILNVQVAIRAPCCRKWFDCAECHTDTTDHPLRKTDEMVFACKKCKKVFRKNMSDFDESDEYCPHCDNHYIIDAKTPQMALGVEGEDARVNNKLIKDDRIANDPTRSIFNSSNLDHRLG
ncbi:hypothetical protein H4R33_004529 [Dimargaris cristalligena]|uniref:CHY-type domain-containing protein n=1 Tax=Dimargaris cristalligena TaxID=215637 RepID=A0A4Q0A240_9FUNG|nr:hypothetical protein H4R33_004529 [Dimargaris cristalligena]RKP40165.1 hypothetical protein BJ085DRAFT_43490 [Dimargaris cristalligena]|eukprot:RKP40165.1 hypothetical protein BJ085DRAFT_43490 [Dimargaris cristalligena]